MTPTQPSPRRSGFTLAETVIAIGIVAGLITVFFAVFALATQGVKQAISVQEADRLAYALEEELTTLRGGEATTYGTGFNKAFDWIQAATPDGTVVVVYQYRGIASSTRADGTLTPYTSEGGVAGQDFVVQTVARRADDAFLQPDLDALEGRVYAVIMTQLVFENGELVLGTAGTIADPRSGDAVADPDDYPEAVIAFNSEFFAIPSSSADFIRDQLDEDVLDRPVFTRNLAIRR